MAGANVVRSAALHRITLWGTVAYLILLAFIAFWPTAVDRGAHGALLEALFWLRAHGAPGWLRYNVIESAANVVLFVPLGVFVVILASTHRWWLGVAVGFVASCAIELGQLAFLPARYATISDVIANTTGAVIGTIIALLLLRRMGGPAASSGRVQPPPPA